MRRQYKSIFTFVQPVLAANGTLGGDSFAVSASSYRSSSYAAWKAFDSSNSTSWIAAYNILSSWIKFYNPDALRVSSIFLKAFEGVDKFTVYGSNDGSNWIQLYEVSPSPLYGDLTLNVNSTEFYKYHRISMTNPEYNNVDIAEITINAVIRNS